jgi:hypothetical protein
VAEVALTKPDLAHALRELVDALDGASTFALVGGLAVSVRVEPRFTRDLDVVVAVDDDGAAEALVRHLIARRYVVDTVLENTKHGRLGAIRLRRAAAGPVIDVLFAATGIEADIIAAAEQLVVLGARVPVARTGHLIAMKVLARDDVNRPQDVIDLRALARMADRTEWTRAARAAAAIEKRGFARRRKLVAAVRRWRRSVHTRKRSARARR